ncbi:MAG: tol-pal system protein YbgF [Gammaproteobacteria bacterium]
MARSLTFGCFALIFVSGSAFAISKAELERRIIKLESKPDNRGLVELSQQLNQLRQDVQQLRGDIEVQAHEIRTLGKKQKESYLDLEQRLQSGAVNTRGARNVTPVIGSGDVSDRQEYDNALAILKQSEYAQAATAFQGFLETYPQSEYADNAQYWLGEVFYVMRQFPDALREFDKVISQYPDSSKVADAKLKSGFIRYEIKDWSGARADLASVVQNFPASTPARLAKERLQLMDKEGR